MGRYTLFSHSFIFGKIAVNNLTGIIHEVDKLKQWIWKQLRAVWRWLLALKVARYQLQFSLERAAGTLDWLDMTVCRWMINDLVVHGALSDDDRRLRFICNATDDRCVTAVRRGQPVGGLPIYCHCMTHYLTWYSETRPTHSYLQEKQAQSTTLVHCCKRISHSDHIVSIHIF